MSALFETLGSWITILGSQLSKLDSPLAATAVIFAALFFIGRTVFLPIWKVSASFERRQLNQLSTALTYPRFREIMGQEPNAYRELHKGGALESRFFVLRRCYVEAYVDSDNRIYGYTLTLRRRSSMGAINVGGLRVRLGRTRLINAWPGGGPEPELIGLPIVRDYSLFEVSKPYGYTTGRAWAVGFLGGTIQNESAFGLFLYRLRRIYSKALAYASRGKLGAHNPQEATDSPYWKIWNSAGASNGEAKPGKFHKMPDGWFQNMERERREIVVDCVSVALTSDIRFSMIQLHSWDIFHIDPPKRSRQ